MNKMLKDASVYDSQSQPPSSVFSGDKNDFNEDLLMGTKSVGSIDDLKIELSKEEMKNQESHYNPEPIGIIENAEGNRPKVCLDDPYLDPFTGDLILRQNEYKKWLEIFENAEGGLENISRSYKKFGLNIQPNNDITFMEWAPAAKSMSIFGDFNGWNRDEFWCERNEFGCWCITLKALEDGSSRIKHGQKYKIRVEGPDGNKMDRNSAWTTYSVQDGGTKIYDCVFWNPEEKDKHKWTYINCVEDEKINDKGVRIYESHVGMSSEGGCIN